MRIKNYLAFLFLFLTCTSSFAQDKTVKKDSVQMYRDIEAYSKKSKFSKFVYKLIFKAIPPQKKVAKKKARKNPRSPYAPFENKIIRKITIETLDPFGYSITNTEDVPRNWLERFGNGIHAKSKNWTIRNYLLFKKTDSFDSIVVKESERLLQSQRFIRRAVIIPNNIANSADSVDVTIRVLDSWSLIPSGSISSSKGNLEITERNFFGLGLEVTNDFRQVPSTNKNGYTFRYIIPNFKNTFIRTGVHYTNDLDESYTKEVFSERAFFSPLTRYAGGVSFQERFYRDSIPDINQVNFLQDFKFENQNYWAGYSFPLFRGKKEEDRITNLVTTVRHSSTTFTFKPEDALDTFGYFSTAKLYLASIGINRRKFIEDSFLFNYGIPEYVQTGQSVSFTGGFEEKNFKKRTYFGGRYALGDYFAVGYLGLSAELGSFFNGSKTEQTTFRVELNYFTDLFEIGNWKLRQFVQPQITIGNNRIPIKYDSITINEENGIQGFSSNLLGTKKMLVAFQTQSYSPGIFWGFRFSPFFNATLAMLSEEKTSVFKGQLYSKFGIGVLISNDYLVFNNFQLSFAFYPKIPGAGDNLFKTNSFKNDDLKLLDYQIGQPTIVPYN
ncbi:MAG: hypothetical protein V4648_05440 [Bacteroidota bacterium]